MAKVCTWSAKPHAGAPLAGLILVSQASELWFLTGGPGFTELALSEAVRERGKPPGKLAER